MCSMWCRIHPRLLIGMPAPAIREMLHILCACTYVHACVCWLSESCALSLSRHYTVYPLSADALVLPNHQSSRSVLQGHVLCVTICIASANYAEAGCDAQFA